MASKLEELRNRLNTLAQQTEKVGVQLSNFKQKFDKEAQKVSGEIGNTATREDQRIVQTLSSAKTELDKTVQVLQQACQQCKQFAAKL